MPVASAPPEIGINHVNSSGMAASALHAYIAAAASLMVRRCHHQVYEETSDRWQNTQSSFELNPTKIVATAELLQLQMLNIIARSPLRLSMARLKLSQVARMQASATRWLLQATSVPVVASPPLVATDYSHDLSLCWQ